MARRVCRPRAAPYDLSCKRFVEGIVPRRRLWVVVPLSQPVDSSRPSAHDLPPPSYAQETPPPTSRRSTRPRQEATVRGVRWALLCTRGRDWASETPRSLRRPPSTFPLYCTHPSSSTDSTCLRPRCLMARTGSIRFRRGIIAPSLECVSLYGRDLKYVITLPSR